WKATRSGDAEPLVSTYLESCEGPERTVLAGELLALDRACRERYGLTARLEHSEEPGAAAEATATSATGPARRRGDVPAGRVGDWPDVHGLELVDFLGSGGMGVVF